MIVAQGKIISKPQIKIFQNFLCLSTFSSFSDFRLVEFKYYLFYGNYFIMTWLRLSKNNICANHHSTLERKIRARDSSGFQKPLSPVRPDWVWVKFIIKIWFSRKVKLLIFARKLQKLSFINKIWMMKDVCKKSRKKPILNYQVCIF